MVIPLLTEKGSYPFVDRVLLVDAEPEQQIRRSMTRDKQSREQIERIMATQSSREQRLAMADDIIDNSTGLIALERQVQKLHHKYRALSLADST